MAFLRKCLGKKSEEAEGSEEEAEAEEFQRRNSIQILNHKRALNCFMAKVLAAKIIQQLISAGYVALILCLPKFYSRLASVYVFIPLSIWLFIFVWAHFVKSSPNFLISVFLLFITSLCTGYFIAEIYRVIGFYFMFLPGTLACLIVTNILFLPFMIFSHLWLNLRHNVFYLVPQLINLGLNVAIAVAWSVLIMSDKVQYDKTLQMRSKVDAILILCVPTLFWSFSLNLAFIQKESNSQVIL